MTYTALEDTNITAAKTNDFHYKLLVHRMKSIQHLHIEDPDIRLRAIFELTNY